VTDDPHVRLASTLAWMEARAPAELAPAGRLRTLEAVAGKLPAALTHWLYLECRLDARVDAVDLVFELDWRGRRVLAGGNPGLPPPPAVEEDPVGRRLSGLCREWNRPGTEFGRDLGTIWMEFDDDRHDPERGFTTPGVFLKMAPEEEGPEGEARAWSQALHGLRTLRGRELDRPVSGALEACRDRLPAEAHAAYLGWFPARSRSTVRLCVADPPDRGIPAYLEALGWGTPGERARLSEVLERLGGPGGPEGGVRLLDLDVEDGVRPRIGLEYILDRRAQMEGRIRETRWLEGLSDHAAADPVRLGALERWPGYTMERFPHELWRSVAVRRVNHVKIVFEPGVPLRAKAYLCLYFDHRSRWAADGPADGGGARTSAGSGATPAARSAEEPQTARR
jgi:hypothetical protein